MLFASFKKFIFTCCLVSLCSFFVFFVYYPYAQGFNSNIEISRIPYLFFSSVPGSLSFNPVQTAVTNSKITSDGDGILNSNRSLIIEDTRGCGGLLLQLEASSFTPAPGSSLNNSFRVISSSQSSQSGIENNGIKYLDGFSGNETAAAPLNTSSLTFSDPALFTSAPFDGGDNILNQPIDLIQGDLPSNSGRIGQMQILLSFYLEVSKYFTPGTYYSTLTFTLTDSTQGNCP